MTDEEMIQEAEKQLEIAHALFFFRNRHLLGLAAFFLGLALGVLFSNITWKTENFQEPKAVSRRK